MKNTSGFTHWVIVILISIMAIGLIGAAWYYEENKEATSTATTNAVTNTNTIINTNSSTNTNINSSGLQTYSNSELGFSLKFPQSWDGYTAIQYINVHPSAPDEIVDYSSVNFQHPKTTSDDGLPGKVSFTIYFAGNPNDTFPIGVTLLLEQDDMRYGLSRGNAATPGELGDLYLQIDDIISTFEILDETENWKVYEEPDEYAIKYPTYWEQTGDGGNLGNELIQLWRHDPNSDGLAHGGQDPNSAKISISINDMQSKPLSQIIDEKFSQTNSTSSFTKEVISRDSLIINGRKAERVFFTYFGPTINTFIEYKEGKYVLMVGFYGEGEDMEMLISDILSIHNSFQTIN